MHRYKNGHNLHHYERHNERPHRHLHQQRHQSIQDRRRANTSVILYPTLNRGNKSPTYIARSSAPAASATLPDRSSSADSVTASSNSSSSSARCRAGYTFSPPPPRTPPSSRSRSDMSPARYHLLLSPPAPHRITSTPLPYVRFESVGNPNLRIFRLRLPPNLMGQLNGIITQSERYVHGLPGGWKTELYSLTKQDLALRDIPGMGQQIRPISDYISRSIQVLYGCRKVVVDKNQPHILKYSVKSGHTGVELHHDRCDVTANLALSHSSDYSGGGTFLPDTGGVVRLERGEFLLHPGSLVHGGVDVTKGSRYIMVMFAHLK